MQILRHSVRVLCVTLPALLSVSCSVPDGMACGRGAPAMVFNLYFGRSIPGGIVLTESQWQDFLNDTVTPNIPGGYTVVDAEGAWMSPQSHRTVRESTKVLTVALSDTAGGWTVVNRIRDAYQVKFHQQLVGLTAAKACADF